MIEDITSGVTGILTALTSLLNPHVAGGSGNGSAVAYVALLALPVLGGSIAMARKLIKKTR